MKAAAGQIIAPKATTFVFVSNRSDVGATAGTGFFSARVTMCVFVVSKGLLLIGPALILGACVGAFFVWKTRRRLPLVDGAMVAFICAFIGAIVLIRFYYRERTPYAYLLFPSAVLTAYALDSVRSKLISVLSVCALMGIGYVGLQISSPVLSNIDRSLADHLRQNTQPQDVVLTNLREQQPPFPSWDTGSREITMLAADRLLFFGIETGSQLEERTATFASQTQSPRFLFLRHTLQPLSADMNRIIEEKGHFISRSSLAIPIENESLGLKLRSLYWRITGSPFAHAVSQDRQSSSVDFELYQINPK